MFTTSSLYCQTQFLFNQFCPDLIEGNVQLALNSDIITVLDCSHLGTVLGISACHLHNCDSLHYSSAEFDPRAAYKTKQKGSKN